MSTIPTSLLENQSEGHIRPHLTIAKHGYECKISLSKVFNYILCPLLTGCQRINYSLILTQKIAEKKKLVGKPFTTIWANGAVMVV